MENTNSSAQNKAKLSLENLPDLLTVREVAEILRVSPLTIKRWGKRGKLPAIRINARGDRRYRKEQVLWLLGMEEKIKSLTYLRNADINQCFQSNPIPLIQ